MEMFLWLWMQDKRWVFGYRPKLKKLAFTFILTALINLIIIILNLYDFVTSNKKNFVDFETFIKNLSKLSVKSYLVAKTVLCVISIPCTIILIKKIINTLAKENKKFRLIQELNSVQQTSTLYNSEYWVTRKCLYSPSGFVLLLTSLAHVGWSLYYIIVEKSTSKMEKSIFFICLVEIIFFSYCLLVFLFGFVFKLTSFLMANKCYNVYIWLSTCCKKKRETLDFSDCEDVIIYDEAKMDEIERVVRESSINEQ